MLPIPTYIYNDVFEIPYEDLYNKGKRIILYDLDNTLASYKEPVPSDKIIDLSNSLLKMGYKVYILSNNIGKRIDLFCTKFPCTDKLCAMNKPGTKKTNKFFSDNNIEKASVILVGDQILTDIMCARKLNIDSVLVKSIDRSSEHWYTRINRLRESFYFRKIKKVDLESYTKMKNLYEKRTN